MQTLTLGEILWDIIEGKPHLGGSPFNVSTHLARMGAESYLISAIGEDDFGRTALAEAQKNGVNTEYILQNPNKTTGIADVFLNQGQPDYTIHEDVAWDQLELTESQYQEIYAKDWDFVVIGILAQRSAHNQTFYHDILENIKTKEVFLDINLRKRFFNKEILEESFRKASILTLSKGELDEVTALFYQQEMDSDVFAYKIMKDFDIGTVCLTLGKDGVLVYTENQKYLATAQKTQIVDTVGAGDGFSAAFIYTLHHYHEENIAAEKGCQLGTFVASQAGALPEYSPEIIELLK